MHTATDRGKADAIFAAAARQQITASNRPPLRIELQCVMPLRIQSNAFFYPSIYNTHAGTATSRERRAVPASVDSSTLTIESSAGRLVTIVKFGAELTRSNYKKMRTNKLTILNRRLLIALPEAR